MNGVHGSPAVSVVIPHQGGWGVLRRCLDALDRGRDTLLEILVVDTGAIDDSIDLACRHFPGIDAVTAPKGSGYAKGCNVGIRRARGALLLLLNNDAFVEAGCIEALVEAARNTPDAAAWQPKNLSARDSERFDAAGAAGGYLDRYGMPFTRGRIFDHVERDRGQYDTAANLLWGSGVCLLLRRAALDEVGPLDEGFFAHMEEIDLCWRLALMGWRTVFVPDARALHVGGATLPRGSVRKTFLNHRNSLSMMVKNASSPALLRALPGRVMLDLAAIGYHLAGGRPRHAAAVAGAVIAAAAAAPRTIAARRPIQRRRIVTDAGLARLIYPGSIAVARFLRGVSRFNELGWPQPAPIDEPEAPESPG